MFTQAFQMTHHPFAEIKSLEHVLQDPRMRQALDRLAHFLEHGTIALCTGVTGVGKTTLLKCFTHTLAPQRYRPLPLSTSSVGSSALLRMIVAALGEKPSLGKDRLFRQIHEKTAQPDQVTLLLIDEAHLLDETALTDLRLLQAARSESAGPLKLLLCGQPPLGQLLTRASLADLAGRISVRCRLHPFTPDQTFCYIDHALKCAGVATPLFEDEARQLLHDHTGGICRAINQLATTCLVHAASRKTKRITAALVNEAAAEMGRY